MLTPYLPYPLLSGGQIRTYNLLKKLANKHEVTLFALIKDEEEKKYIPELQKYCTAVRVFKRSKTPFTIKNIITTAFSSFPFLVIRNLVPEVSQAIKEEIEQQHYDLIHAETFYMMPHIPKSVTLPIILVEQTIEYLGYESYAQKAPSILRPLLNVDIRKIKHWEKHYWNACETLIVMSQDDKEYIEKEIGEEKKIEVVANGVDASWFAEKKRQLPSEPTVLSVGTFKWLPNVEAVNFLIHKVWPHIKKSLPSAKLWIVGNAPTKEIQQIAERQKDIIVSGRIPDIRDAFSQAHVLVAPVFSGKGTRYKIIEALASGTPVVATPTAVEGLNIVHKKHALIGTTADEIASLTLELLNDTSLQDKLAKNGRTYISQYFDWNLIAKKLDTIYQKIGAQNH